MSEVRSLCLSSLLSARSIPFHGDHPSGSSRKVVAFGLEWVAAFKRNQWSPSNGMAGRLGPEYAVTTVLPTSDGHLLKIRQATTPEPQHRLIYRVLEIPEQVMAPVKTWLPIGEVEASS